MPDQIAEESPDAPEAVELAEEAIALPEYAAAVSGAGQAPHGRKEEIPQAPIAAPEDAALALPTAAAEGADEEEVLSAEFLETPEEAAADQACASAGAAEAVAAAPVEEPGTVIRPSRRLGKEQPVISERKRRAQRQARLIIRGGMALLMLACVAAGSYRIPLLLGKGLIWPWNVIFQDKAQPREKIVGRMYKTASGQMIDEKEAHKFAAEVRNALGVAERLFADAKAQYEEGNKIEAIVTMARAQAVLGPIANRVRENPDLPPIQELVKPVENMDFEINTKNMQWRRELDINDADRLQKALREAELLPDDEHDAADDEEGGEGADGKQGAEEPAAKDEPAAEDDDAKAGTESGAETQAAK